MRKLIALFIASCFTTVCCAQTDTANRRSSTTPAENTHESVPADSTVKHPTTLAENAASPIRQGSQTSLASLAARTSADTLQASKGNVLQNSLVQASASTDFGTYKWITQVPMIKCNYQGEVVNDEGLVFSEYGQKFIIADASRSDYILIKIVNYEDDESFFKFNFKDAPDVFYNEYRGQHIPKHKKGWFAGTDKKNKIIDHNNTLDQAELKKKEDNGDYGTHQLYFKVPVGNILKYAIKAQVVKTSFAFGVLNFPLKFRAQKSSQDFSGAFNINLALGVSLPHKAESDWLQSFVGAIGVSNISLDTSVVSSFKAQNNGSALIGGNTHQAITFSFGYIIQYQKVQAGIFTGIDRLSYLEQQQLDWKFQGKPWISIAFGFSVFSPQKAQSSSNESQ